MKDAASDPNDDLMQHGESEVRRRFDQAKSYVPEGAKLLDELHAFLGRFVAYPSEHAHIAHVLWIVHTHLMDAWDSTPRIAFLSPEPGSGKTRALELSDLLVPRPVNAVNVTPAYLFRKVADPAGRPTILFDEIDTVFGPRARENEEIRGLLNAGHRRGAVAGRCVVKGKIVETEEIPAYCAVALAGLDDLPDTVRSRSIIVRMRRRAPNEQIEEFRHRIIKPEGEALRERISIWADQVGAEAAIARPKMPLSIKDRDADVWEPMLAIADLVGGRWPENSRVAAVTLVTLSKAGGLSLGLSLLSDLRRVFGEDESKSTASLLKALHELPESPWTDIKGKPLNDRALASRLRRYEIGPKVIRMGSDTIRGYLRSDFHDAWSRYLGPLPNGHVTSVTGVTASMAGAEHH